MVTKSWKSGSRSTALMLAGAALFMWSSASSAKLLFMDNNVQVLYGSGYHDGDYNAKLDEDDSRTTYTLEHFSTYSNWGDVYGFIDYLDFGNANSDYYAEVHPRLSFGKITGSDLSFGPVKDVLLVAHYERGAECPGCKGHVSAQNLGVSFDLNVPGFNFVQVDLLRRDEHDPVFDHSRSGHGEQMSIAWSYPFSIGSQDFAFDGFIDWRSPEGSKDRDFGVNYRHSDFSSQPQLKWDAGKAMMNFPKHLYVGIEYWYWNNKYGVKDGGSTFGTTNDRVVQAMVQYHF